MTTGEGESLTVSDVYPFSVEKTRHFTRETSTDCKLELLINQTVVYLIIYNSLFSLYISFISGFWQTTCYVKRISNTFQLYNGSLL